MHMYIHAPTHTHVLIWYNKHKHIGTQPQPYMRANHHTLVNGRILKNINSCKHIHAHALMHASSCVRTRARTHTYACMCNLRKFTHTQACTMSAHTHALALNRTRACACIHYIYSQTLVHAGPLAYTHMHSHKTHNLRNIFTVECIMCLWSLQRIALAELLR